MSDAKQVNTLVYVERMVIKLPNGKTNDYIG